VGWTGIPWIDSRRPDVIGLVGIVGLLVLLWLMMFKPF